MESPPLGGLPAELRNNIYELLLHCPTGIQLDASEERPRPIGRQSFSIRQQLGGAQLEATACVLEALPIMATSKQIRRESMSIFMTNTFILHTRTLSYGDSFTESQLDNVCDVEDWIAQVGGAAMPGELVLHLGLWCPGDDHYTSAEIFRILSSYVPLHSGTNRLRLSIAFDVLTPLGCDEPSACHVERFGMKLPLLDLGAAREAVESSCNDVRWRVKVEDGETPCQSCQELAHWSHKNCKATLTDLVELVATAVAIDQS